MSEQAKITVYVSQPKGERIKVEIDPKGEIYNLAEEAARKFSDQKTQYIGFELLYNGRYLHLSELNSIIKNGHTVDILFSCYFSQEKSDGYFYFFDDGKIEEYKQMIEQGLENVSISSNDSNKDENNDEEKYEYKDSYSTGVQSSWSLLRIIIGIIDLLLSAAAIITFLLNIHIAVPIFFTVLLIINTVLFFVWNKILPKSWMKYPVLKANLNEENKNKEENNLKIKLENEKEKYKEEIY